jgi:hypothetical protein
MRTRRSNLRHERRRRGWSIERAIDEIVSTAAGKGIPPEVLDIDGRQYTRWENGENQPRRLIVWLLSETYGLAPELIDLPPIPGLGSRAAESDTPAGKIADVERRDFLRTAAGIGLISLTPDQITRLIAGVAHESRTHVGVAELSNVGPVTLEQLASDVARLSRMLVSEAPLPVFAELVRVRDVIYSRLMGRQRPAQTAELYLLAGQTCGLLANVTLDMGYKPAAAELAHTTWAYGDLIGHGALAAFGRATQSVTAYWSGGFREAVDLARAGQTLTDSSNIQARLMTLEARAQAKLGNGRELVALVDRASEFIDNADSWPAPGGHLAFTSAKLNYYAANAYADAGRHNDAIVYGERSLKLYRVTPNELRSYGDEALCHVTLAEVSVRKGAVDGAVARLAPVLAHAHTGQLQLLRSALGGLRLQLSSPRVRGAEARALAERIDSF